MPLNKEDEAESIHMNLLHHYLVIKGFFQAFYDLTSPFMKVIYSIILD